MVLNYDDPTLRALAPKAMCRVVWFSRTQIPPFGAFVREETLYFGAPDSARAICGVSEVRIPGRTIWKTHWPLWPAPCRRAFPWR